MFLYQTNQSMYIYIYLCINSYDPTHSRCFTCHTACGIPIFGLAFTKDYAPKYLNYYVPMRPVRKIWFDWFDANRRIENIIVWAKHHFWNRMLLRTFRLNGICGNGRMNEQRAIEWTMHGSRGFSRRMFVWVYFYIGLNIKDTVRLSRPYRSIWVNLRFSIWRGRHLDLYLTRELYANFAFGGESFSCCVVCAMLLWLPQWGDYHSLQTQTLGPNYP